MSTLNKIYYGSAGTGKTREATIEAVKIIAESEKVDFKLDSYENILQNFKTSSNQLSLNIPLNYIVQIQKQNDLEKILDNIPRKHKITIEDIKNYKENYNKYPLVETVTFHPSYTYQDFVEGISVETTEKNQIIYKPKDGIFKKLCDRAIANKDYNYVLLIDEINRGDISSIFGELFTLLEDDKRKGKDEELSINLPYSKDDKGNPKKLSVPSNLFIVASMNTVDKSIALIDVALRRRFDFIEMKPDHTLLKDIKIDDINLVEMLKVINDRITILKNEHYQIGHSYFLKIESFNDLKRVMTKNIIPLLQEYFYDDWQSICAVLNQSYTQSNNEDGLFDIKKADDKMFSNEFKDLIEFNNKRIVTIRDFKVADIKTIY